MGNSQRLDGGAMFGNVPKAMWSKWVDVDALNRINLVCRCMLIEESLDGITVSKRILFETGIGSFFEPKLRERFGVVESEHVLLTNLAKLGLEPNDIDVIVLSHLHFDHAGGLLSSWQEGTNPHLLFNKAKIIVSQNAFERSTHPHPRDKASFIPGLPQLLMDSNQVIILPENALVCDALGEDYSFHYTQGHTPGLLLTEVASKEGAIIFAADLIPGTPWMRLAVTMGYDRFPEKIIEEKENLLAHLAKKNGRLFFTHDPKTAMAQVCFDDSQKQFVPKNERDGFVRLDI